MIELCEAARKSYMYVDTMHSNRRNLARQHISDNDVCNLYVGSIGETGATFGGTRGRLAMV